MRNPDAAALLHQPQLHRHQIRRQRRLLHPEVFKEIQLGVRDHVLNIPDHRMIAQIRQTVQGRGLCQIAVRGRQMQMVIRDLLHRDPPRLRRRHRDRHIRLALRQVDHTRKGNDLQLQLWMIALNGSADLRQDETSDPIRCPDPYLPG